MSPLAADRDSQGLGRSWRMILLTVLPFLVLVLRLFFLQVIGSEDYLKDSKDNSLRERRIPAPRGLILDRRGRVLAENVAACELSLPPQSVVDRPERLDVLAEILDKPAAQLQERCERALIENKRRVVVERSLSKAQILVLEERAVDFDGLELTDWARRSYPHSEMAGHILGYVGEVNETEVDPLSQDPRAYRMGDLIGRAGVEETYEQTLRGTDGKDLSVVNARGDRLENLKRIAPEPGHNLVLTLDLDLCALLDSSLAAWGAGAGVVVDVRSGEILAAASRPAYDPNLLVGGIPTRLWRELSQDPGKPLFNRVTQATYAPGSTFKTLVLLEGLSEGVVNEHTRFQTCNGGLQLGRRYFRCWDAGGHGRLAAVEALAQSCDVYFYQLGELLGIDALAGISRRFALGERSGIEIAGEVRGLVPDRKWYDRRYGEKGWTTGNVWNVSIGQGELLVNCLQMARLYAAIANGGFLPYLRLRHHVEQANGLMLLPFSPPRGEHVTIDPAALRVVREGLEAVLAGEDGTARASAIKGFPCAGKTGTTENPHGLPHAWFCGYAPAENAEIAIALIVEHGEHGSSIAPIFSRLVRQWFDLDRPRAPGDGVAEEN